MPTKVKFYDKNGNILSLDEVLLFDAMSNAPATITFPHHKIHEGESFTVNVTDETLADAETLIIAFKTAAGLEKAHLFVFFATLVGGSLEIWEDATWTTNTGTATPIINRKRDKNPARSSMREDKTATPLFTVTGNVLANPTGLGTGSATSLDKQYAWGEKGKIGAGYLRDENEFVLRPDTKYAVVFTAIGSSNKAQIALNWYESEDKT